MPEFLEKALAKGAKKQGLTGKKAKGYIYGAMNNLGAMHGNKETKKGAAMQRKHEKSSIAVSPTCCETLRQGHRLPSARWHHHGRCYHQWPFYGQRHDDRDCARSAFPLHIWMVQR